MSTPTRQPVRDNIDSIVRLWLEQDWTLQELADEYGVTRQRISQLLIEAGYSPAELRAKRIAARATRDRHWRDARAVSASRRAQQRDEAVERFRLLAVELGVSPVTLGQFAAKAGVYAKHLPPRSTITLPPRRTPEGDAIAARAYAAAAPWAVRHVANLAARSTA